MIQNHFFVISTCTSIIYKSHHSRSSDGVKSSETNCNELWVTSNAFNKQLLGIRLQYLNDRKVFKQTRKSVCAPFMNDVYLHCK